MQDLSKWIMRIICRLYLQKKIPAQSWDFAGLNSTTGFIVSKFCKLINLGKKRGKNIWQEIKMAKIHKG